MGLAGICLPNVKKMWQDMGGVELFHRGGGDEFVGISEALDERLEFADDGGDLPVGFEFLLNLEPKQPGLWRFQVPETSKVWEEESLSLKIVCFGRRFC